MKDWIEISIGDLGEVITGNTPPTTNRAFYGGPYPFIKPTDMEKDSRYVRDWEETYSELAFKRYESAYIPKGAVGVVTIGTIGEKLFQADRPCFTNQSVNVVIPNKNFDDNFVYYLLKYNLFKVRNANPGTASGRDHVSKSNFCSIKITVPKDKAIQKIIGEILSAYDDLIENNNKRITILEQMAEQIYKELFVRMRFPGYENAEFEKGVPKGWEVQPLSSIARILMGQSPKSEFYNNDGIGLPFHQGVGSYGKKFPTHDTFCSVNGRLAKEGDILFSVRAPVGRINIADQKLIIGRGLGAIKHNQGFQSYLFYLLNYYFQLEDVIGNGSIFNSVGKDELNKFKILQPSNNLDKKFNDIVVPIDKQMQILYQQNKNLKQTRDLLLPRLISGKLRVKDLETVTKNEKV